MEIQQNRTTRVKRKKTSFEKKDTSWIDQLSTVIKRYNNTGHRATTMSAVHAPLKENTNFVMENLKDKRKKQKPEFKLEGLIRTTILGSVVKKRHN